MRLQVRQGGVKAMWGDVLPPSAVALAWLGQAGFAVRSGQFRILIDAYLSDHLAIKYKGAEFPHVRMMPPPIAPGEVRDLDLVLCSHRHSDHMDPGLLPVVAQNNPACRFIVPRAESESAARAGISADRMIPVNAGEIIDAGPMRIEVIPAAHEELKTNEPGEHHFLGFILRTAGHAVYHSGDCVLFPGLADLLRRDCIDLALLPVNGRDPYRTGRGIIGNMTFDEAVQLCRDAGIPTMIAHHFGLFDFNTVDKATLYQWAGRSNLGVECLVPQTDTYWLITD